MSKSFLSVALLAMSTIAASAADVESVITGGKPAETQLSGCKDNDFSVVNTDFSKETGDDVFDVVEKMPEYKGGTQGLMTYIQHTVKYPETAKSTGLQGKFVVQFIINDDGSIIKDKTQVINVDGEKIATHVKLPEVMVAAYAKDAQKKTGKQLTKEQKDNMRIAYSDLEKECIRVVNNMEAWTPGQQRGKNVKVKFAVPITFRLQ